MTARTHVATTRDGAMLAVLVSAMFMAQFDFFVVNVAAPDLQHDLHAARAPCSSSSAATRSPTAGP
jgi:hypothetical protein